MALITIGTVVPEWFTHGTSEQRVGWFRKGFENGEGGVGDTCDTLVFGDGFEWGTDAAWGDVAP